MYEILYGLLDQGITVALATIIEAKGSTPRGVGTQMIVHPEGKHQGTIGGGAGEAKVIQAGLDVIRTGKARTVRVELLGTPDQPANGVCGGYYVAFVEPWHPTDTAKALANTLATTVRERTPAARVVLIEGERPPGQPVGTLAVYTPKGHIAGKVPPSWEAQIRDLVAQSSQQNKSRLYRVHMPEGEIALFIEHIFIPPRLIIVGAGHIAVPLAQLGKMHGFRVTVIDDRAEYVTRARFPAADDLIIAPLDHALRELPSDTNTYLVLLNRGYPLDIQCLRAVAGQPFAYIGMIGSKRRVRTVLHILREELHLPADWLAQIHAPVGLDIGAETPEEIATAIMAEIILARRGGTGRPLRDIAARSR